MVDGSTRCGEGGALSSCESNGCSGKRYMCADSLPVPAAVRRMVRRRMVSCYHFGLAVPLANMVEGATRCGEGEKGGLVHILWGRLVRRGGGMCFLRCSCACGRSG